MMTCKHCGNETSTVICEVCGINVVWYNKYGVQHDIDNPGELAQYDRFIPDKEEDKEADIEQVLKEVFVPDGSGD